MQLELYNDKIYPIKPRTIPPDFVITHHYAKWVSPRTNDIRIDKFIDIPFANIIFLDAYAKGDLQSGERFVEIGAATFPSIIRAPFASLSPNEFRFPSKNLDQNIRHVLCEVLKNSRFVALGDETIRFLSGKQILCLDTPLLIQAHIASLYTLIRDKVPFRCDKCQKYLWIEAAKLPENPIRAKCPGCGNLIQVEAPGGFDRKLSRFVSGHDNTGDAKGDVMLSTTGEFRKAGAMQDSGIKANIDFDLDKVLGTSPFASPPVTPPTPQKVEPALDLDSLALNTPTSSTGEPGIELDDDFFKEILPTAKDSIAPPAAAAQMIPEPLEVEPSGGGGMDPSLILHGGISDEGDSRKCHVCGYMVGHEKICPKCFSEVAVSDAAFTDMSAPVDSGIEIRLKEIPEEKEGSGSYQPSDEAGSHQNSAALGQETLTVWDEKIWVIKIGDEIYENLDMKTVEKWILEQSVMETDLVRKGDAKWVELKTVPYFRTAFKRVKEMIEMGSADATAIFSPAATSRRIIALVIDSVILSLVAGLGFFMSRLGGGDEDPAVLVQAVAILALPFIYLSVGNGILGRTVGKKIMSLAVINNEGKVIGLKNGAIRAFIWLVTYGYGFALALLNPRKQALHDKIAKSFVIQLD